MTENHKIISEIEALLEEQVEILHKELTPDLVVRYGERHKRIRELLDRISRDRNGQ